jgi:hypothetical protein
MKAKLCRLAFAMQNHSTSSYSSFPAPDALEKIE